MKSIFLEKGTFLTSLLVFVILSTLIIQMYISKGATSKNITSEVKTLRNYLKRQKQFLHSLHINNSPNKPQTDELDLQHMMNNSSLTSLEILKKLGKAPTKKEQLIIADILFKQQEELEKEYIEKVYSNAMSPVHIHGIYRPILDCKAVSRMGKITDGGKWICDSWKLSKLNLGRRCIAYSWGGNAETSFEKDMIKTYGCEVHTFDPTVDPRVMTPEKLGFSDLYFHQWGLGPMPDGKMKLKVGREEKSLKTFTQTMAELGHNEVDIQKVDCERCEIGGFNILFDKEEIGKQFANTKPKIILVETHIDPRKVKLELFNIFRGLKSLGYYMYMRERNPASEFTYEWSFVHRDYFLKD
jgi:hypothetical protein